MTNNITPFAISLLIGLFIGIERERSHPAGLQTMGVRTFMLIALLGTLSAVIDQAFLTLTASFFVVAIIVLGYYKSSIRKGKKRSVGITTEVAAIVVYFLGYLTPEKPLLAAVVGIVVLLALLARTSLHTFSREKVKTKELYATIVIMIIALGVVPFLPDHTIDPWHVFNPRQYTLIIVVLLVMQFSGYVAVRIFGQRIGLLLTGFFSGLVSSTAVFLMLPKLSHDNKHPKSTLISAAVLSTNAMLIETILLISLIAPQLIYPLIAPFIGMLAIGFFSTWPVLKSQEKAPKIFTPRNPLDFLSVLKLATFFAGMLALITISKRTIGINGVHVISFLGGLFEIHSVNIANASLFTQAKLTFTAAQQSILLAIVASFVTKYFLLWTMARNKFAFIVSLYLTGMLIVGAGLFLLV